MVSFVLSQNPVLQVSSGPSLKLKVLGNTTGTLTMTVTDHWSALCVMEMKRLKIVLLTFRVCVCELGGMC